MTAMHEAAVVGSLVALLCDQAARHNVAAIRRVTIRVGRLAAVEPAALAACFDILAEDTPAAGAELVVETVPVRVRCRDCRRESDLTDLDFHCAHCRGSRLDIVAGKELRVESIEVEPGICRWPPAGQACADGGGPCHAAQSTATARA